MAISIVCRSKSKITARDADEIWVKNGLVQKFPTCPEIGAEHMQDFACVS